MNSSFVKIPAQLSIIGGQKKRESVFANKVIFKDNHMPCDVNNNGKIAKKWFPLLRPIKYQQLP